MGKRFGKKTIATARDVWQESVQEIGPPLVYAPRVRQQFQIWNADNAERADERGKIRANLLNPAQSAFYLLSLSSNLELLRVRRAD